MKEKIQQNKFFNLILFLFPITIIILLLEIIPRLLFQGVGMDKVPLPSKIDPYDPNPYIVYFNPYLFAHIPHSKYTQSKAGYEVDYEINSFGFRSPEFNLKPAAGKKRIVFIGDSLVEGHGSKLADSLPAKLEQELRNNYEVLNCGVQGGSPVYYASNLERYLQLNPDYVIISLYDNDIYEDRFRELNQEKYPFIENPALLIKNYPYAWLFKSRFIQMVYYLYKSKTKQSNEIINIVSKNKKDFNLFFADNKQNAILLTGSQLFLPEFREKAWAMSIPYLDYLLEKLKNKNIPVYFVSLSYQSVNPNYVQDMRELAASYVDYEEKWAKSKNVPFFTVREFAKESYKTHPDLKLHIEGDGHPTKETHAKFAKLIADWLRPQLK
jgi:lysophospholipase L1-like esterase